MRVSFSSRLLQFKQPATTSRGTYETHLSYFIEIEHEGIRGIGEASVLPDLSCDAMPWNRYETMLKEVCRLVEKTEEVPYEQLRNYPSILFALETAMEQLKAKGSYAFFQTDFAEGRVGIPINSLIWMGTFEEMDRRIREKLEEGSTCIKLKIGGIHFEDEMRLIQKVRKEYKPEEVTLRLDANGSFAPADALEKIERLAPYGIHSIEQPIAPKQMMMAKVCRESCIPIALDEELIGVNTLVEKLQLVDNLRPHFLVLKPSLHGGMYGTQEWQTVASTFRIGTWMTSALESNIGLNAIAQWCAKSYGDRFRMPQGLGTGQLYADNFRVPIYMDGNMLWYNPFQI